MCEQVQRCTAFISHVKAAFDTKLFVHMGEMTQTHTHAHTLSPTPG